MIELPKIPSLEQEKEKTKRKATTLYLDQENYKFVKSRLKKKSISQFIDEILEAVSKSIKEELEKKKEEQKQEEKEDDKKEFV